jgi:predicted dehydrogenase
MKNIKHIIAAVNNRLFLKTSCGPIGIGLIGIGGWGATNAINIMRTRRFNIIGVHDSQTEIGNNFAKHFKTKNYHQIQDLMNNPNIQAVAITVPNHLHADMVKVAADAGKHIFIEKPLASASDICRALGRYCQDRRVILQVGHQMRREPVIRKIKGILEVGELGRPLYIQGVYTLERKYRDDWRRDARACPGGSMEQLGVHLIDVLIYLFGTPQESHGWRVNIPFHSDAPDWGCVLMSFDHDVHASISTSFSSPFHMRMEFFFDRGNLSTDGERLWIKYSDTNIKTEKLRGVSGGVAQFIDFADCLEHGKEPETSASVAAEVMNVVRSIFG